MKLYAAPFACSLAPLIVLHEANIDHDVEWVDMAAKALRRGGSYYDVNPKGKISSLERDDGTVLTENVVVLTYLGGLMPEAGLAPPRDSEEFLRLLEWLNFVATELHKQFLWTGFVPAMPDGVKPLLAQKFAPPVLRHIENALADSPYLMGETFTVADAYLYWAVLLLPRIGVDLAPFPSLAAFRDRVPARPRARRALAIARSAQEEFEKAA